MRIFYGVITFFLVLLTPYWIYVPLIILGLILFPLYLEAIFFGLLIDTLYGGAVHNVFTGFPFGIGGAVLVLLSGPLRNRLRL